MWKYSLAYFYIIFVRFINCCQCNTTLVNSHKDSNSTNNKTDVILEKRQLIFDDFGTTEYFVDTIDIFKETTILDTPNVKSSELSETTTESTEKETTEVVTTETHENTTAVIDISSEANNDTIDGTETNIDLTTPLKETSTTKTTKMTTRRVNKIAKHTNKELLKKCRHFKKGSSHFDFTKMADVWQVVFYRLPNKLKCFKLHIILLEKKEQLSYAKIYGNFNRSVHWSKCHMEIKSTDNSKGGSRRHFLQGSQRDKGVMENIIIDEEHCENTTFLTLYHESADQWVVMKNILVMRDCDTGDVVVFARVPLRPSQDDILDALMVFGENTSNGTMACEDQVDKGWLKYENNDITIS